MARKEVRVDIHHHRDKTVSGSSHDGELVTCAACKGTGREPLFGLALCSVCKGKGKVRV